MGIGENAHIAFNDPAFAKFDDPEPVKVVELDDICRNQQVNDGCFAKFDDVPTHAITLTIPTLMSAKRLFCMVPRATKAEAVRRVYEGEIEEACPASIMRRHDNAIMYCDADSAKHII
jgi:glucosamine-6-phosphate deaminase